MAMRSTQDVAARLGTLNTIIPSHSKCSIGEEDEVGCCIFEHVETCWVCSRFTGMHDFCHKVP